jgi:hypothetical protein
MSKHRDIIAIEREADQEVRVTIGQNSADAYVGGQATDGGGAIPGGFSQLFNRVISSLSYAKLPEAAKLVYPALVWMADHRRQFVIENRGYTEIARYAGVSRSTAQKGLARLIDSGLVRLALAARPNGFGGLTANIYQLLVPIDGIDQPEFTERAARPHTVSRERGIPQGGTPLGREPVRLPTANRADPVPRSGRYKQEEELKNNNSVAKQQLAAAGIREPVLGRLVGENDEEQLLLRLKDWENRRNAGSKLGVAWLIASIQQKYELHESTQEQLDQQSKSKAAAAHRIKKMEQQAAEDRRQKEIDDQVQVMFDDMSDEELDHWKGIVVEELPSLIRNPETANPRTHERLRRLILGKLVHLIAPPADGPAKLSAAARASKPAAR